MSLFVHHMFEAMARDSFIYVDRAQLPRAVKMIAQAEKFSFGELPLERTPTGEGDGMSYTIPELTDAEREMFGLGLVPLPAPVCWFEISFPGGKGRSGILVYERQGDLCCERLEFGGGDVVYDGTIVRCKMQADGQYQLSLEGNTEIIRKISEQPDGIDQAGHLWGSNMTTAMYLILMLNSASTTRRREDAPPKLNLSRARSGKGPLFSHTLVQIVPDRIIRDSIREGERHHAPPRLHWRRSHLRRYDHPTPTAKFIEGRGWLVAIPRCVVGRAELGEISHEYRVHPKQPGLNPV